MTTTVYRNEGYAKLLTVVAAVFGLGAIAYLAAGRGGVAPTIVIVAMALFVYLRLARAGAYVEDGGIRIVNPGRTIHLPWERIDRFSLRAYKGFPALGFADLVDGERVEIWGIQARKRGETHRVTPQQAIDGLNERLDAERARA
jgi:PH (Pleckstrin Homology) domain-containing protein